MTVDTVVSEQDAREPQSRAGGNDDLSSHRHRRFIGYAGLLLPILLVLIAGLRPTDRLPRWNLLNSVSAYYYTGAVAVFVGILVALAFFLFTYRGYNNDWHSRDRIAAVIAALAAIVVASFPTGAPNGLTEPSWWVERTGYIHYVAAIILFCSFSFFCLFQFPKSRVAPGESVNGGKRARNGIYYTCGIGMLLCIFWAWRAGMADESIFWPEVLALGLFATSWLAKGRVDRAAVAAGRRTARYGRDPGRLIGKSRGAVPD